MVVYENSRDDYLCPYYIQFLDHSFFLEYKEIMAKLYVKIISVDPSILVRFASDNSKKPIDDYPPMLFGIPDISITTPEAFIESIRPQLEQYVQARDATESNQSVDVSSWIGYSSSVDMQISFADPVLNSQIIAAQAIPEVVL